VRARSFTLLDLMNHFNAENSVAYLEQLNTLTSVLTLMKRRHGGGALPQADDLELAKVLLGGLLDVSIACGYGEAMTEVQTLQTCDLSKFDYSTMLARMEHLRTLFHKALTAYRFLQVRPGLTKYLEDAPERALLLPVLWPPFSRDVLDAFPSATYDIREAGNCLAVECNTASVFHLMRVAEYGMRALAWDRRIKIARGPIELATWEDVIRELEKSEQQISQYPKSLARDAQYDFFHGVMMDLRAFKNAFRNQVMHTRSVYSNTEAVAIYERVSSFMNLLSSRITEGKRTQRIWKKDMLSK
jgi:hypothetical protein